MKRAVFLDLEGPIVTRRSVIAGASILKKPYEGDATWQWIEYADKTALLMMARLCEHFKADLVITSMLRSNDRVLSQIYAFLMENNADVDCGFSKTPHLGKREDEISAYVKERKIDNFVVVDDKQLRIQNFILVSPIDGITLHDYERCVEALFDCSVDDKKILTVDDYYL